MTDDEFTRLGITEMVKMGLIDSKELVLDAHAERVKKAYPAYFDTYEEIDKLIAYINNDRQFVLCRTERTAQVQQYRSFHDDFL